MDGGTAGTNGDQDGPEGGARVTSGSTTKFRLGLASALLCYAALQVYAIVSSAIADDASAGRTTVLWKLWTSELSSAVSWLIVIALLWRMASIIRPPRFGSVQLIAMYAATGIAASALHVAIMHMFRWAVWRSQGEIYSSGGLAGWPYELRKDLAVYLVVFLAIALVEWFLASKEIKQSEDQPITIRVSDGSRTLEIPADEIDAVEAAGNYVEIHQSDRSVLHRATMQAMEDQLSASGFVRVHRSHLVRRTAIRTIEVAQSGDFTLELESGRVVRGSRRYRAALN